MSSAQHMSDGLQVVPDDGKEVHNNNINQYPEVVSGNSTAIPPKDHPPPNFQRPLSFKRKLLVFIAAIIVLCAVVGGAVGGTLGRGKSEKSTQPTSSFGTSLGRTESAKESSTSLVSVSSTISTSLTTSTTSTTSTSGQPLPTAGILALNCPSINDTRYTATVQSTVYNFQLYCQRDFRSATQDIDSTTQYSLESCIQNCALRNNAGKVPSCQGLTFDANLTSYKVANCFLKTGITGSFVYTADQVQAGAVLIS